MLIGRNVKIRGMEKKDAELFFNWMSNQDNLGCFIDVNLEYKDTFTEKVDALLKDKSKFFAIIEDNDKKPIGIINYRELGNSSTTLEIGVLIAESSARGRGIGGECLQMFTDHLFSTKPIMRLQYLTRAENAGMIKIGQKAGYISEGILRNYMFEQGSYRDFCMMAIIREDWLNPAVLVKE